MDNWVQLYVFPPIIMPFNAFLSGALMDNWVQLYVFFPPVIMPFNAFLSGALMDNWVKLYVFSTRYNAFQCLSICSPGG